MEITLGFRESKLHRYTNISELLEQGAKNFFNFDGSPKDL